MKVIVGRQGDTMMHWLRSQRSAEEHAEAAVLVQQGDVVQMEVAEMEAAEMEADAAEGIVEDAGGPTVVSRKVYKGVKGSVLLRSIPRLDVPMMTMKCY